MKRLNQPVIDADDAENDRVDAREVDRNARIGEKRFSRESKRLTENRSRRMHRNPRISRRIDR